MPTCVWRRACGVESTGWGNWPSVTEPSRRSTIATVMQPEVTYQPFTLLHNNFIIIIIIMAIVYAQFKLFAPHQVTSEMNNNFYVFLFFLFFIYFLNRFAATGQEGAVGTYTIGDWSNYRQLADARFQVSRPHQFQVGIRARKMHLFLFVCCFLPRSVRRGFLMGLRKLTASVSQHQ